MTNWLKAVSIPKEVHQVIGNTEVKTDQDILNRPLSLRISDNHKRQLKVICESLTKDPKKKWCDADAIRYAIETMYDSVVTTKNT